MSSHAFVLILGMHRSGTSCLAGCLESCGLFLGRVSRRGRFNAKGNRESKDVWQLHDQILGLNRGAWYRPPDRVAVHPTHLARLRMLVDKLSSADRTVGVKDPRILLLLQHWRELIGPRCRLVGTFRHPLAVVDSLAARNNMPLEQSLSLWVRYNQELVRQHREEAFPLLEFDLTDPGGYRRRCAQVARELGLHANLSRMRRFVSRKLNHHRPAASDVPTCCRQLYDYLQAHAVIRNDGGPTEPRAPAWLRSSAGRVRSLFVQASQMPPNADF